MSESTLRAVELGDFFEESWGYDQTNVDFYQVVRISETGKTVWLRHVRSVLVDENGPTTHVAPMPDGFNDDYTTESRSGTLTKRLRQSSYSGWAVTMTSYSDAYLWDCKPAYETASGWGH